MGAGHLILMSAYWVAFISIVLSYLREGEAVFLSTQRYYRRFLLFNKPTIVTLRRRKNPITSISHTQQDANTQD
jgi:hypothetical protein